ncbi:hypothetical protein ACWCSD_44865, partial [Nonomuraea sp. NPDC001684]
MGRPVWEPVVGGVAGAAVSGGPGRAAPVTDARAARALTSAGTVQQNRDDQIVSQATARLKEIRQIEK